MSRGLKFATPERPVAARNPGLGPFIRFSLGAALLVELLMLILNGRL